jgi:hypothetical protein
MNKRDFDELQAKIIERRRDIYLATRPELTFTRTKMKTLFTEYSRFEQELLKDFNAHILNASRMAACLYAAIIEANPVISVSQSNLENKAAHTGYSEMANYELGLEVALDLLLYFMKTNPTCLGTGIMTLSGLKLPPQINDDRSTVLNLVGTLYRQHKSKGIEISALSMIFNFVQAWYYREHAVPSLPA